MKRMYSKAYQAAMAALMLTAATACTGDNDPMQDNDSPQAGRLVTVTATQPSADTQTRTTHQDKGKTVDVNWKAGDVIYIGKEHMTIDTPLAEAGYVTYTLASGAGSKNATFTSATPLVGLEDDTPIFAFYGRGDLLEAPTPQQITFNLSNKGLEYPRQTANGNMDHIADWDFMYAEGIYKQGQITNFKFHHGASLMKFDLTLPDEGITVRELHLSSVPQDQKFLMGSIDLVLLDLSVPEMLNISSMTLKLGPDNSGFICTGNKLTAYMMIRAHSTELNSRKDFNITVTDANYMKYVSETMKSSLTTPGKFYTLTATLRQMN